MIRIYSLLVALTSRVRRSNTSTTIQLELKLSQCLFGLACACRILGATAGWLRKAGPATSCGHISVSWNIWGHFQSHPEIPRKQLQLFLPPSLSLYLFSLSHSFSSPPPPFSPIPRGSTNWAGPSWVFFVSSSPSSSPCPAVIMLFKSSLVAFLALRVFGAIAQVRSCVHGDNVNGGNGSQLMRHQVNW